MLGYPMGAVHRTGDEAIPMLDIERVSCELIDGAVLVPMAGRTDREIGAAVRLIAARIGRPWPHAQNEGNVERLAPRSRKDARPNSLSAMFGRGEFPAHTDQAHRLLPPRFLILAAAEMEYGAARTTLVRVPTFTSSQAEAVRDGVFLVSNGSQSFYSSILRRDRRFVRFDAACMTPTNTQAVAAARVFMEGIEAGDVHEVEWRLGDILVVDNWKMLHGRARAEHEGARRVLLRLYATEEQ
jgi:alpha-ketoglutarate-dependent taurine dioxygenase